MTKIKWGKNKWNRNLNLRDSKVISQSQVEESGSIKMLNASLRNHLSKNTIEKLHKNISLRTLTYSEYYLKCIYYQIVMPFSRVIIYCASLHKKPVIFINGISIIKLTSSNWSSPNCILLHEINSPCQELSKMVHKNSVLQMVAEINTL